MTPRWLTDHEQQAWRGYLRMSKQLDARLNREMQLQSGISHADFEVMVNLSEAPERKMRAFELGAVLQWEKSRLSHHLTRMQNRSLVLRRECPHDARGAFIELTDEGLVAIESAAPLHVESVRNYMIDLLTPEQLDQLDAITTTVLDRLQSDAADCPSEQAQ